MKKYLIASALLLCSLSPAMQELMVIDMSNTDFKDLADQVVLRQQSLDTIKNDWGNRRSALEIAIKRLIEELNNRGAGLSIQNEKAITAARETLKTLSKQLFKTPPIDVKKIDQAHKSIAIKPGPAMLGGDHKETRKIKELLRNAFVQLRRVVEHPTRGPIKETEKKTSNDAAQRKHLDELFKKTNSLINVADEFVKKPEAAKDAREQWFKAKNALQEVINSARQGIRVPLKAKQGIDKELRNITSYSNKIFDAVQNKNKETKKIAQEACEKLTSHVMPELEYSSADPLEKQIFQGICESIQITIKELHKICKKALK